jgi:poly(3-hydroxybutyrate) depolymerase
MTSTTTSKVLAAALGLGLVALAACGSSDSGGGGFYPGAGGASTAGAGPTAGASGGGNPLPTAGASGAPPTAGAGGAITAGGASGAGGAAPTAGASGSGTAGAGGSSPTTDITAVVKTTGCGMDPTGFTPGSTIKFTIQTSGTKPTNPKCADGKCGDWSYARDYFVTLPTGYDKTKAYPLVLEGPGCGGHGTDVYPLTSNGVANANNTVIRVGLSPPPNDIQHATNAGQGCFDDKEGDDSVDWVFYENLYDKLAGQICFDKNRVFSAGNSSGAWFSNELGCKYAGDPTRPVRGIMPNTGGLPTEAAYRPTCTNKPMAGMWVGETMDMENAFSGNVVAINRAIQVNGCTGGDWGTGPTADFPIGGGKADSTCKKLTGCPANYPLVVCLINGNQHASHDDIANPGFTTFLKLFSTPPLISQ